MIRNLIPSFIFLLLISACSKDPLTPHEPGNEEKQLLSLTVDGFSQSLLPFADRIQAANLSASLLPVALSSSGTNLSEYINTLEFKVYHKGNLVDSLRQYDGDPEFGKYENYLPPDGMPYSVFVTGAMLDLDNEDDIELKRGVNTDLTSLRILPDPIDAFFFFNSYTMGIDPQTESIQLKRFVGRLEIDLIEEIPNDAHRLEVTVHNTAKYFMPVSERGYHLSTKEGEDLTPYNTFKTILIKPEDRGRTDYSFNMYFVLKSKLGSEAEITNVTIKAFDTLNKEVAIREINDVILQVNKRTKLTGIIFSHHPNRTFDIELDSDWDSEVPEFRF
ncbi:hypothetical protein [Albibacterium bauzanense]|uniref:Fimbrillin-A associated anchor protein Mfa1/Mfa2 n=1 Tax=Albibacterium bauzanense TaxID=653929 RepID=A0A4R1LZU4_9SPHI|nr:hypothetical protein [Albibacterium bauzanense]TCK84865.1 hypothetical protein C8N28_0159 [Albibacterium bauzanense]